jgi:hypothetical protein
MNTQTETPKLKKITRAEWVDALRSGEYKQGGGFLYDAENKTYCCLGVACALAGVELENFPPETLRTMLFDDVGAGQLDEWLGLDNDKREALAEMNDNEDLSFADIADEIEKGI